MRARLRLRLRLVVRDEHRAVRAVPGGNAVAPPELARDAPGLDVAHPGEERVLPLLRHEFGAALLPPPRSPAWPARRRCSTTASSAAARSARRRDRRAAPDACAARSSPAVPSRSSSATIALRAAKRSLPSSARTNAGSATPSTARRRRSISASVTRASGPASIGIGSPCRWPTSKSLKSCAGVIFTAPVPFSGSEYSSAMIGMRRPTSGSIAMLADQVPIARIVRMHRDRGVAQHRLRPRGRHRDEPARLALDRDSGCATGCPCISWFSTSRSEIAVCSLGSQFTSRRSR